MYRCGSKLMVGALVLTILPALANANPIPTMWGVDEDDGRLFSIGDYTNPYATFTDYGRLQYVKNNRLHNVGRHIGSLTAGADGLLYMTLNKNLAGLDEPLLLSIDLASLNTTGSNVVTFVGEIDAGFNNGRDNITGLSVNPLTGEMYALLRNDAASKADRLLIIDPLSGSVVSDLGEMKGIDQIVGDGEDLVFDSAGRLYVTDNQDDHLYLVDAQTASIVSVVDANEAGGLNTKRVKFEALAWDPLNNRLIAADDDFQLLAELTPGDGENVSFGKTKSLGLTDVEGLTFVPEPATLLLVSLGMWRLFSHRRRLT